MQTCGCSQTIAMIHWTCSSVFYGAVVPNVWCSSINPCCYKCQIAFEITILSCLFKRKRGLSLSAGSILDVLNAPTHAPTAPTHPRTHPPIYAPTHAYICSEASLSPASWQSKRTFVSCGAVTLCIDFVSYRTLLTNMFWSCKSCEIYLTAST